MKISTQRKQLHVRLRQGLALVRLMFLYILACGLIALAGLLWQVTMESGAGLNRTLPRPDAPGARPPFAGVNVQLEAYPERIATSRLTTLRDAGFGWARQHFEWRSIEPEPGRFDWDVADRMIDALAGAELEPVVVLNSAPDWALAPGDLAAGNVMAPPVDFVDFARFAEAFAQRYGDRVRYYQIWDEPNIAPHWGARHINPVEYTQMLRTVVPAIRNADDDAVILTAALAPTTDRGHLAIDEVYFLQRMIATGAACFFDIVAIQPFGFGRSPSNTRHSLDALNFAHAALIRRALVDAGLGAKPIWAVRYGWNRMLNSPWGTVTPSTQAAFAQEALARAWNDWPWLATMGWAIDRPAEPPGMPAWGFALTTAANAPAPVFDALATWQTTSQPERLAAAAPIVWPAWAVLLLGAVLVGWRSVAATHLLDWRDWLARFRRAPWWVHAATWLALIVIYYLTTFPPLVALCWLAAALLCLAQPQVGLWLAVALIPFFYHHKEVQLVNAVLTAPPAHVLAFALLPAILAAWDGVEISTQRRRDRDILIPSSPNLRHPSPHFHSWELAPLFLIPMTLFAAINVWHWPAFLRGALDLVIVPLMLWLAVRVLAPAETDRKRILMALFAGGVLAALVGLVGWPHAQGADVDGIRRLVGPHFSPNHTALYLERTLFVGLAVMIVAARRWRVATLIAVLVVAAALVLTGSRGALLLGAPAGLMVLTGFAHYRRPGLRRWLRMRRDLTRTVVLGAGVLLVALIVWQQERLSNLQTMELRLELWMAAMALWRDHFWAGVGPGGFFWSYPAYLPVGAVEVDQLHPHSLWLELVTTWGVLGLAWFLLCAAALAVAMRHQCGAGAVGFWIAVGVCAGLAAGLAHAQTDTFMMLADLAAWNAVAWALATAPEEIRCTDREPCCDCHT
ncbi:MAG: O-antigen ligase family protein [Caldilinea sp.]